MTNRGLLSLSAGLLLAPLAAVAAPAYVQDPNPSADEIITDFETPLALTRISQSDTGLTISQRRELIDFAGTLTFSDADTVLTTTVSQGSDASYLYKYVGSNLAQTGDLSLDPGTASNGSNLSVVLDLGASQLDVEQDFELQGAIVVATVNSLASSDGAVLDGVSALLIDSGNSGRFLAGEILEITSGNSANFKLMLDLNSTLRNGANYVVAAEDAGSSNLVIGYQAEDFTNSILFDTSYVMNSSAQRSIDVNNNESITVTFNRTNDEYINKAFTRNHPSDDAALKLGQIAADGVALGDMQTALTLLDINDFGYGNNAQNLAVQVKRLAPIANNSFIISHFDAYEMVNGAVDYRMQARRGNWSGYSDKRSSVWHRALYSEAESSGSVPFATADAQDNAGHDGYKSQSDGVAIGFDRTYKHGGIGIAYSAIDTRIVQLDDRLDEQSKQEQELWTLYGQIKGRYAYANLSATRSESDIVGVRKTAVNRVSAHEIETDSREFRAQLGRRFDMPDGRTAVTPHVTMSWSHYEADPYQETEAGALSLAVSEQAFGRHATELGVAVSHKRRIAGAKALSIINLAAGKDSSLDDLTITARYTGDTHTAHAEYTTFTTPAEAWATNYLKLGLDFQFEPKDAVMFKFGIDAELRNNRQRVGGELGLIWVF